MKKIFNHSIHGTIEYSDNIWTGARVITVNGKPTKKIGKKTYIYETEDGRKYTLSYVGNETTGATLDFDGEKFEVVPKIIWYEIILAILPLLFNIIWGNVKALVAIFPIISGAVGGAINGACIILSLSLMKRVKNPLLKILVGLGVLAISILVCYLIALAILKSAK